MATKKAEEIEVPTAKANSIQEFSVELLKQYYSKKLKCLSQDNK
jgi:hypothetical protein